MRLNLFFGLLLSAIMISGCKGKRTTITLAFNSPNYLNQEMEMLRSPITGLVESQNVWNYILQQKKIMGEPNAHAKAKIYPQGWRKIDDHFANLSIQRIVYDPNNTQTMYFCTGEGWNNADAARGAGVWKSTNGGDTWMQLPSTFNDTFWYCHDMKIHPITSDVYVATRERGLMRSKDGGNSWAKVLGSGVGASRNEVTDIEITADNELVVCIGNFSTDGIYFSESGDEGSWEKRMSGMPSSTYRIELATAPSNADVMYAVPTSSVALDTTRIWGVYKSENKGKNWKAVSLPDGNRDLSKIQGWYDLIIKVSPTNENLVLVGGLNVYRTTDGGENWQQMFEGDLRKKNTNLQYVHVDQHEIVFKDGNTVLFGNDGGIYKCDDIQADKPYFYSLNQNYNVTQFYSCDMATQTNKDFVIGGTQDNGSVGSKQSGVSDFRELSWADGSYCNIDDQDADIFYTTTQYRRIYRTNHGVIDTLTNGQLVNNQTLFINPIEMDPNNPEILYQLSARGLWQLQNARTATKNDWKQICRPFGAFSAIGISKSKPNLVFIGRTGGRGVYRIDNALTSAASDLPKDCDPKQYLPSSGYCHSIFVNPINENHVVITYTNYDLESVWECKNVLDSIPVWVSHEGDLPNIPIRWAVLHPQNPEVCYIATEVGVMMTKKLDGANTRWESINNDLPNVKVNMLRLRAEDNTLVAATHGRGIFVGKIQDDYNVVWQERGPTNVGGRTRTLMFDPNDSTGKKLWAGSVSGGLWVTENVDVVTQYYHDFESDFEIKVGPNPVEMGSFSFFINNETQRKISYEVVNSLGQLIWEDNFTYAPGSHELGFPTILIEPGVYFAKVSSGDYERVFKVVVK
ncbi:MAG: T9SS type A sorting domain-containing protein [Flavobacteriales bacterium]|nr:T9SS type A sorting domain-containing protein [Flavobacteriales bacterium]